MKGTCLVVGMGIGQLYKKVLEELDYKVVTVDPNPEKNADYPSIYAVQSANDIMFDLTVICTPNYTHEGCALDASYMSKIVIVDKPGVETANAWNKLYNTLKARHVRLMMVKNNMWRDNISEMKASVTKKTDVVISWDNANRVPNPGSWFTTKEKSFGGVSRDLMPHLLSLFVATHDDWRDFVISSYVKGQTCTLEELSTSDYGVVDKYGTYDVDDVCNIDFYPVVDGAVDVHGKSVSLRSSWKSPFGDDISFRSYRFDCEEDYEPEEFPLGLCPESAYKNMLQDALTHTNDDEFWLNQLEIDLFIHKAIA